MYNVPSIFDNQGRVFWGPWWEMALTFRDGLPRSLGPLAPWLSGRLRVVPARAGATRGQSDPESMTGGLQLGGGQKKFRGGVHRVNICTLSGVKRDTQHILRPR